MVTEIVDSRASCGLGRASIDLCSRPIVVLTGAIEDNDNERIASESAA
jgi:hypothetical protein